MKSSASTGFAFSLLSQWLTPEEVHLDHSLQPPPPQLRSPGGGQRQGEEEGQRVPAFKELIIFLTLYLPPPLPLSRASFSTAKNVIYAHSK